MNISGEDKGIIRVKGGYRAQHYYGAKKPIESYFSDKEYGSAERALESARSFMNWAKEKHPRPDKQFRKPGMGQSSDTSSRIGETQYFNVWWTTYPDEINHERKFYWRNDVDKAKAEKDAAQFLAARERELDDFISSQNT